jgi:5-methylcytosine-specific restriction endonuclease McrA
MLNAWFEVDHKIRLADGGSNHVDNLVAYCRECHGEKTAIENL